MKTFRTKVDIKEKCKMETRERKDFNEREADRKGKSEQEENQRKESMKLGTKEQAKHESGRKECAERKTIIQYKWTESKNCGKVLCLVVNHFPPPHSFISPGCVPMVA